MSNANYRLMTETTGQRIADALENITAMQGPKGDKGDTGDTGPTGPKGDPGDDYTLTSADKTEIAGIIENDIGNNYVKTNAAQTLTEAQMQQARQNIGVDSAVIVESVTTPAPIMTIDDGAAANARDLVIGIEPVQDLNGYDHPWAGGGGKNLLNNQKESTTTNGITFTVNSNGTVTATGTATNTAQFWLSFENLSGDFYFTGCPSGGYSNTYDCYAWDVTTNARFKQWDGTIASASDFGKTLQQIQIPSGHSGQIVCRVYSGVTVNGIVFEPMIVASSETDSTYAPYSNICPISGWTGANVIVSPTQDAQDGTTYSITFPSEAGTVYGGTLDVTSGKLSRTQEIVTLDGSSDEAWGGHQTLLNWFFCLFSFKCQQTITENSFKANWLKPYYGSASNIPIGSFMYLDDSHGVSRLIIRTDVVDNVNDLRTYLSQNNLNVTFTRIPLSPDIDIDPVTVNTLLGQNNVWADCGYVQSLEYVADTKLYIQKINTPTDDDMTADAQIASGKYFIIGNNLYLSTTTIPAGDTINPGTNCTLTNLADALNAINA